MEGLEVLFRVADDKREEFLQSFLAVIGPPGSDSERRGVFEDVKERGHFLWIERWTDPVEFEQRTRSDEFQVAVGAIKVLGALETMRSGRVFVESESGVERPSRDPS